MSHVIRGFKAVADLDARVLVLGSMPGLESLTAQQYYAHPRNVFWWIMATVLRFDLGETYQRRCHHLLSRKIALWDVLRQCERIGSLDSSIQMTSARANDFSSWLESKPAINAIVFNGRKAEQLFQRHAKTIYDRDQYRFYRCPSTSPAYAAMSKDEKLEHWRQALDSALAKGQTDDE